MNTNNPLKTVTINRLTIIATAVALVACIAAFGLYASHSQHNSMEHFAHLLAARIDATASQSAAILQRLDSGFRLLNDLSARFQSLDKNVAKLLANSTLLSSISSTPASDQGEAPATPEGVPEAQLPPLPTEINAHSLLFELRDNTKLPQLFANPALNPRGTEPDFLTRVKVGREIVKANADYDNLSWDLQLEVANAREKLATTNTFIDYAPTEPYNNQPGVLTFAEKTANGDTRMYSLYREDFPEVYALREKREQIAESALRRVAQILR